MLRFALERKGGSAASNPHYALPAATTTPEPSVPAVQRTAPSTAPVPDNSQDTDDSGGLYL